MRDDELQILGAEAKQRNRRKRMKVWMWVAIVVFAVIGLGQAFRYAVKGWQNAEDRDETEIGSTIVPELQQAVDSLLNDRLTEINGQQGQVIVMEVQTGRILAMVGLERTFDGKYRPCENFGYQQEPGSTMKAAALLALLETGEVKLTDEVDTEEGVWQVDDYYMKDHNWLRGGYGKLTLERALEVSSNIGISKMVQKTFKGKELRYFQLLDQMRFGQPDSIEGILELRPMLSSSPKDSIWASYQMLWNSIGYERKMAPIQMLTFYNAIANGGRMVRPTLRFDNIEVINEQIASRENITQMQIALSNVVMRGLGRKAGTEMLQVAGKSGTAEVNEIESGECVIHEYHLSFCGFFPADSPRYSIIVSMNKLGLPASGGGMAGPVFHDIVEWMITHGMPPVLFVDDETNDTIRVTEKTIDKIRNE